MLLLLFGGGGGCIPCEFAELIVTAAGLSAASSNEFSSDTIIGWGRGEGEEGIIAVG